MFFSLELTHVTFFSLTNSKGIPKDCRRYEGMHGIKTFFSIGIYALIN